MTTNTTTWRLHSRARIRSFRSAFVLLTATYCLPFYIYTTANNVHDLNSTFICLSYIVLCLIITYRHFKEKHLHIVSTNGRLFIPRFLFPNIAITLSNIRSIENHSNSKEVIAISLGCDNKTAVLLDRRIFETTAEFDRFIQFIERYLYLNAGVLEDQTRILSKRSEATKNFSIGILSSIFFMVYVFAAKSNYETIESFIAVQGGLTKETFSHDQFYRLASSFFLHLTPFHLGLNILTLAIFGRYVEVIFGRTKFFNVLLLSAFSGSMISWLFSAADVVVGASGGIYGLIGAYFIAWKKYNRFLPGSTYVSDRTMYFILVAQIIVDINLPNIDMFSHIGGFCSGLLYAAWSTKGRSASKASTAYPFEIHISHVSSFAYFAGLAYFFVFILAPSI